MTIYTLMVDPERGAYLAISASDPAIRYLSPSSEDAALGALVAANPGILVDRVVSIDWSEFWEKKRPPVPPIESGQPFRNRLASEAGFGVFPVTKEGP